MEKHLALVPHPDFPPQEVRAVTVWLVATDRSAVRLRYAVHGASALIVPPPAAPERADDLWKTTCFEAFVRDAGTSVYYEFNFAPSGQWAAYRFDAYRAGMAPLPLAVPPHIAVLEAGAVFWLDVDLDLSSTPAGPLALGLSAVIEERGGTRSFWALAHLPGRPDFHADAGFAFELG